MKEQTHKLNVEITWHSIRRHLCGTGTALLFPSWHETDGRPAFGQWLSVYYHTNPTLQICDHTKPLVQINHHSRYLQEIHATYLITCLIQQDTETSSPQFFRHLANPNYSGAYRPTNTFTWLHVTKLLLLYAVTFQKSCLLHSAKGYIFGSARVLFSNAR